MKTKPIIVISAFAALLCAGLVLSWRHPELPHFPLAGGGEFRVFQITYTAYPSESPGHSLGTSKARWWIWRHLPSSLQNRVSQPAYSTGSVSSARPALSIWWAWIDPATHQPMLGPAGAVIMTLDSGRQINLGWPTGFEYHRCIFITDPPTHSRHLTFDVPVEDESVRFTIRNPAYRR